MGGFERTGCECCHDPKQRVQEPQSATTKNVMHWASNVLFHSLRPYPVLCLNPHPRRLEALGTHPRPTVQNSAPIACTVRGTMIAV